MHDSLHKRVSTFIKALLLLWLCPLALFSQDRKTSFGNDSLVFFEELSDYLIENKKKEGKELTKEFEEIWFGGFFTDNERKDVYRIANKMLEKRMLPFPEISSYIELLIVLHNSEKKSDVYNEVYKGLDDLIEDRRKRPLFELIDFVTLFLGQNALFASPTTSWKTSNNNYQFTYDKEIKLVFEKVNLSCYAKGDSMQIFNTSGSFSSKEKIWKGSGGETYFERAGFNRNQLEVYLGDYEINTKLSNYQANDVTFKNTVYFGDAILNGNFEDRLLANTTEETSTYPRLISTDKRLRIKNLIENVDFEGGFRQNGLKFIGAGDGENSAKIIINRNDKAFLIAESQSFIIRTDRIVSQDAAIKIYMDGDSIFHPGLVYRLNTFERMLTLSRGDQGNMRSPFFNSFHEIDMYFEQLEWIIDDPVIRFKPFFGSTNDVALFESNTFYQENRYDGLLGIDYVHPLVQLKKAVDHYDSYVLTDVQIARVWGMPPTTLRPQLMRLSYLGLVSYNYDKNEVTVKEKLIKYVKAKAKMVDYDVIQFNSRAKNQTNAKLNLLNYDLTIYGVKGINLSDTHNVMVFPFNQEVLLKRNRDFLFDGVVTAGKFEYFGYNFDFSYNKFEIEMAQIDSLRIYAEVINQKNKEQKDFKKVGTTIENLSGRITIDMANNKASLRPIKRFPVFQSDKESYAYYNRKSIQNGVYPRDSFYFQLQPFVFDSLNSFSNERINFEGTFVSAGIFPDFEEMLTLQPDYSLGFVRETPEGGFDVYRGKGKFENAISLSNNGLKGDGVLEYLTSTAVSKAFSFYPDSTNAICDNFVIEEQMGEVEYPPVSAADNYLHWEPFEDNMVLVSRESPFIFYDGESKFDGVLKYDPNELIGGGIFKFKKAELEANLFTFKFFEFFSDTADFRYYNEDDGSGEEVNALNLSTTNVNAHVDFRDRKATFISNDGTSLITFHDNQYMATMDRFVWFMDKDEIELTGGSTQDMAQSGNIDLEGAKFTSIHPKQDSLAFVCPSALYDLKKKIIYAKGVKYIDVADAEIIPDSGKVTVEKRAVMRTLQKAIVIANKTNKYHTIYDATIDVFGRRDYKGSGSYDYLDVNNYTQKINLPTVAVDSTYQTYAIGEIVQEDNFTLGPVFKFKGNVNLQASKRGLVFKGYTQMLHECDNFERPWFFFNSEIDPDDIYIPIDSLANSEDQQELYAGGFIALDPVSTYSTFISPKSKSTDQFLFASDGYLNYNSAAKIYHISNFEKINERSLPGNYISLHSNNCNVIGEGKMTLGLDLGRVDYQMAGSYEHYTIRDSLVLTPMMLLDFFFDDKALKIMADQLNAVQSADGVDFQKTSYQKNLQEFVGKQEADRLMSNINLYQNFRKFPSQLEKTFLISELNLKWSPESESFVSQGDFGIGNIGKRQVNKRYQGKIEFVKRRSGDILNIYIKIDNKNYYFFQYQREVMQAFSSNEEFNTAIREVKAGKNKLKKENRNQAKYSFILSSPVKVKQFTNRFDDL